jgi:hypothetical protein
VNRPYRYSVRGDWLRFFVPSQVHTLAPKAIAALARCLVHLQTEQDVTSTFEAAEQDGYSFRAVEVWPSNQTPVRTSPEVSGPSAAYSSTLTLILDDEDEDENIFNALPTKAPGMNFLRGPRTRCCRIGSPVGPSATTSISSTPAAAVRVGFTADRAIVRAEAHVLRAAPS